MIVPNNDIPNLTSRWGFDEVESWMYGLFLQCKCGNQVYRGVRLRVEKVGTSGNRFKLPGGPAACQSCGKEIKYMYKLKHTDCTYIGVTKFLSKEK